MKKFLVGFFTLGIIGFGIYALGYFRQFLEIKFNDGLEFNVLPSFRYYKQSIDDSTVGIFMAGCHSVPFLFFLLIFFIFAVMICYRVGESVLNSNNVESESNDENKYGTEE